MVKEKRFKILFLILTILFFGCLRKDTFEVDIEWVSRYDGETGWDIPYSMVLDKEGNIYVTGKSWSREGDFDYCTIKYDKEGKQLWVKKYNGEGDSIDFACSITTDNYGNIYVTGSSFGANTGYDYLTIKYDKEGNQLWVRRYQGEGDNEDVAFGIASDRDGNIYVTGYSGNYQNSFDFCTIKYDGNGNLIWVRRYKGPIYLDYSKCVIAIDNNNNIYVGGESEGDACIIKYDKDGNLLWVRKYEKGKVNGMVVDKEGNIYITGESYEGRFSPDYLTIKYDKDGNLLWARRYNGTRNLWDYALAIVLDNEGNIYVTGGSVGDKGYYEDYLTIKYDKDGKVLWVRRYNSPENSDDEPCGIVVDEKGNVYLTGRSVGVGSNYDYCTIKYDKQGNELGIKRYNGPANYFDEPKAIILDNNGNIYITGKSCGVGTSFDYCTIKYHQGLK